MELVEIKAFNLEVGDEFRLTKSGRSFLVRDIDDYDHQNKVAVKIEDGPTVHIDMGSTVYIPSLIQPDP